MRRPVPAIEVDDLSVSYRIRLDNDSAWADIRDVFHRRKKRENRERVVPALRGVSFDVPQGSVTAVIGRNGAGKTTLLRTLSGVLAPETGRVVVRGQMNLLAPGIGFNQSLSGRENIRLGGLANGMVPERIDALTGEIAEFAELDEYIEYPIKTYSSGMKVALGLLGRRASRPRDPADRRGALRGRRGVRAEGRQEDGRSLRPRAHHRVGDPQPAVDPDHGHQRHVAPPGSGGLHRRPR
ncbi:MAG: ATP-binding cassette domain-containing protein [Acidimicrobiales bacterium]|nr:ATP-binding cassette domain-containing protein [Acidimicrobiales bacterium]